ncbi:DUF2195 family protein [Pseudomonas mangrovi]|uniref:DUF2195 domain-containing protein n=1 Tax=Pseudomonas mangrovi TaxID=2161748 RepID=A0A2T5PE30_9PSED|nr:DUF2195 family protein [Pseudomonas mangrovi]PTU75992.1 hypothetical protein DBO85_02615 [Pseudomonas mangrovi]
MSTAHRALLAVLLSSAPSVFADGAAPLRLFNSLAPCVEIDRLRLLPGNPPQLSGRIQQRRHRGECGCVSAVMAYQLSAKNAPGELLAYGRFMPPADGQLLIDLPGALDLSQASRVRFTCAGPE